MRCVVVSETSLHACSEAGNTTVQTETYTDWSTRNGLVEHNVSLLITPNAVVSQFIIIFSLCSIIIIILATGTTMHVPFIIIYVV